MLAREPAGGDRCGWERTGWRWPGSRRGAGRGWRCSTTASSTGGSRATWTWWWWTRRWAWATGTCCRGGRCASRPGRSVGRACSGCARPRHRCRCPGRPRVPRVRARHGPRDLVAPEGEVHPADVLRGRRVVGFAGIGRPSAFRRTLEGLGAEVVGFTGFPDHHPFGADELRALERQASGAGAWLVTTEKDRVRCPEGAAGARAAARGAGARGRGAPGPAPVGLRTGEELAPGGRGVGQARANVASDLSRLLSAFRTRKLVVLGDLVADHYVYGPDRPGEPRGAGAGGPARVVRGDAGRSGERGGERAGAGGRGDGGGRARRATRWARRCGSRFAERGIRLVAVDAPVHRDQDAHPRRRPEHHAAADAAAGPGQPAAAAGGRLRAAARRRWRRRRRGPTRCW